MSAPTSILRRVLTVLVAVTPLLASADVCTIGAVTGRASLSCPMDAGAPACHVAPRPAPKCSHCAPAAPVRETPRPSGATCCDVRPQAAAAAEQPVLGAPAPSAHPAWTSDVAVPVVVAVSRLPVLSDDGRAPPADLPPLLFPRAPPLA